VTHTIPLKLSNDISNQSNKCRLVVYVTDNLVWSYWKYCFYFLKIIFNINIFKLKKLIKKIKKLTNKRELHLYRKSYNALSLSLSLSLTTLRFIHTCPLVKERQYNRETAFSHHHTGIPYIY
jgi:hypothetical protein